MSPSKNLLRTWVGKRSKLLRLWEGCVSPSCGGEDDFEFSAALHSVACLDRSP